MSALDVLARPLDAHEASAAALLDTAPTWLPIVPIPDGVRGAWPGGRKPDRFWVYRDAQGRRLCIVARFDGPDGKQIRPLTWCENAETGERAWRWQGLTGARPLYGRDRLADRPDAPVLLVEGEKATDAAQALFPGHVAMSWLGGAASADKVDWSPLAGRTVLLWPDNDDPGRRAMGRIAERLTALGCLARTVAVPGDWPQGWDLADDPPGGVTVDDLQAMLDVPPADAQPTYAAPDLALPPGYRLDATGLWHEAGDRPLKLSAPFDLLGETRDGAQSSWGLLIRWRDRDGAPHSRVILKSDLAGECADLRAGLMTDGLDLTTSHAGRQRFVEFLSTVRTGSRARIVRRTGWDGLTFALPDEAIGAAGGETVLYHGPELASAAYSCAGSLAGWRDEVSSLAAGNSRLLLAISAAFAAPLLNLLSEEGGGLHLRGGSSIGKTTALLAAASVWGPPASVRSWRATGNGLEAVAAAHNDALLCLDEMGQVEPREAGAIAYMLANGVGKARAGRAGDARPSAQWRTFFLSTGEVSLADRITADGRGSVMAGQLVRCLDIDADAGAGFGLFDALHREETGDALARRLKAAARRHYGTPARAFIGAVAESRDHIIAAVRGLTADFAARNVPAGADGQVSRAAGRFAIIGAAGETATALGLTGWHEGEAMAAVTAVYGGWLSARGNIGSGEAAQAVERITAFIATCGASRFQKHDGGDTLCVNRAGWREGRTYRLHAAAFREAMAGLDPKRAAKHLAEAGILKRAPNGEATMTYRPPGGDSGRVYTIMLPDEEMAGE